MPYHSTLLSESCWMCVLDVAGFYTIAGMPVAESAPVSNDSVDQRLKEIGAKSSKHSGRFVAVLYAMLPVPPLLHVDDCLQQQRN